MLCDSVYDLLLIISIFIINLLLIYYFLLYVKYNIIVILYKLNIIIN